MTKQELFADPQFLSLSEQQREYVRALVENGNDQIEAVKVAYNCKNLNTAKAVARRNSNHAVIRRLVDTYYEITAADRIPTREEFAARMWERGEGTNDSGAAFKYYQLFSDLQKFKDAPATPPNAQAVAAPSEPVDTELMAELEKRGFSHGSLPAPNVPAGR